MPIDKPKESSKNVKLVRLLMFIGGCTTLGFAFGWQVGIGIFLVAPALFSAIRGK